MGWSDCGDDSKGRPIGYGFEAICDHPGCTEVIDRGLAYACGSDHGGGEWFCEDYFCSAHLRHSLPIDDRDCQVCDACYAEALAYAKANPEDANELVEFFTDMGEDGFREE